MSVMRVLLQSTPLFLQLGLGDTFKTVKIEEDTTMDHAAQSIVPKLTRGLEADTKKIIEESCAQCVFYARHTTLGSFSLIDPDDLALDWIPTGIKGKGFAIEFGPQNRKGSIVLKKEDHDDEEEDFYESEDEKVGLAPKRSKSKGSSGKLRGKEAGSRISQKEEKEKPLPSYFGNHLLHLVPKIEGEEGGEKGGEKGGEGEKIEGENEWMLPPVFVETSKHLQAHGMHLEGIFRISASTAELEEAKSLCDDRYPLTHVENTNPDSLYLSAALLKVFLRELVEPLCTWGFYKPLLGIGRLPDAPPDVMCRYYGYLVHLLPQPNLLCFQKLIQLLHLVQKNEEVNKMSCNNLSVVVAPSICKQENGNMMSEMTDIPDIIRAIETIIENADEVLAPPSRNFFACVSANQNKDGGGAGAPPVRGGGGGMNAMAFLRGMGGGEEETGGEEWMEVNEGDVTLIMPSGNDIFSYPALNLRTGEEGKLRKTNIIETFLDISANQEPPAKIIFVDKARKEKKEREKRQQEKMEKKERRKTMMIVSKEVKEKEKEGEKKAAKTEKKERVKQKELLKQQDEITKGGTGALREQLLAQVKVSNELNRQLHLHSCVIHSLSTELYQLQVKCQEQQKLLQSLQHQSLPPPLPVSPLPPSFGKNISSPLPPQPQLLVPTTSAPVGKRAPSPLPPQPQVMLPTPPQSARGSSPLPPPPPQQEDDITKENKEKGTVLRRSTSFDGLPPTLSLPPPPPPLSRGRGETVGVTKVHSYSPTPLSPPSSSPASPPPSPSPQLSTDQCEILGIIKRSLKTKNNVPFPSSHVEKLLSERDARPNIEEKQLEEEMKAINLSPQ